MKATSSYNKYLQSTFERLCAYDYSKVWLCNEPFSLDHLVNTINETHRHLSSHTFDDNDEGAFQAIFAGYLNEIWITEILPDSCSSLSTLDLVDKLLAGQNNEVLDILKKAKLDNPERVHHEIVNLTMVCQELFGKNFHTPIVEAFDTDLVQRVHKGIALNVIDSPGTYRKKPVGALGSKVIYASPETIPQRLSALLSFVNQVKDREVNLKDPTKEDTKKMIMLGSFFFSEFLLIHPFIDGNGRTARLLLNYLLKEVTVVPFSLYLKDRDTYIQVLEERVDCSHPPVTVAAYTFRCAYLASAQANWLFLN